MKDQLSEPLRSDADSERVCKALEKAGFERPSPDEFVRGKQKVILTPTGFHWMDGQYKEFDLTVHEVLSYLRK